MKGSNYKEEESQPRVVDIGSDLSMCDQESIQVITIQTNSEDGNSQKVSNAKQAIPSFIDTRKTDTGTVLPDPIGVRQNHNLLSMYCEKKIAVEIVTKKAFGVPDETSINKIQQRYEMHRIIQGAPILLYSCAMFCVFIFMLTIETCYSQ